jgi:hypothetical protein
MPQTPEQRRRQLTRHPARVEALVRPPTRRLASFLDAFEDSITVARYRALLPSVRELQHALHATANLHTPVTRAGWAQLRRARRYLAAAVKLNPHLNTFTPAVRNWRGWLDHIAAAQPDWRPGVEGDRAWLAERERELASERAMQQRLDIWIAELRVLLAASRWPLLTDRMQSLHDQLCAARVYYSDVPPTDPHTTVLAALAPQGSA